MKKTIAALMAAVCLMLAGCSPAQGVSSQAAGEDKEKEPVQSAVEPVQSIVEEVEVGGGFHADPIYGVFRNIETGEADIQIIGQINYYDTPMMEEYAENLSWATGLDFAVEITEDELGTAVEWLPEATLFDTEATAATFYGSEQPHQFEDNNALRWFMLDSLAETLRIPAYGLHYTMDGGNDLVLEGLEPVDTFPADEMYWSSHGVEP